MAPKSENIFVRAKAYQKLHPRTSWSECIQKVKGKKVSGAKGKKVVRKKTVAGTRTKRRRIEGKKLTYTTRPTGVKAAGNRIGKAVKLLKEIEKLEAQRKNVSDRDLKDLYAIEINHLHHKLRNLKKSA